MAADMSAADGEATVPFCERPTLSLSVLSGCRPSPEVLATGVWVAGVYALTAIALVIVDRARARGGLTE